VKDFDPKAYVKVLKATIRENGETKDVEMFSFTLQDTIFD
jgi:hypothetical protein